MDTFLLKAVHNTWGVTFLLDAGHQPQIPTAFKPRAIPIRAAGIPFFLSCTGLHLLLPTLGSHCGKFSSWVLTDSGK